MKIGGLDNMTWCIDCFYSRQDNNETSLVCCCLESPFLFRKVKNNGSCCKFDSEESLKEKVKKRAQQDKDKDKDKEEQKNVTSNVDHPERYTKYSNECIDEMITVFGIKAVISFCMCNVWKYRYRNQCEEDLQKADWYMNKARELVRCSGDDL